MKRLIPVILLAAALAACAARPIHPGAANSFDSTTYDTLITAKSVIDSTKVDLANNAFPVNVAPTVKTAVNGLITAYDALDTSYTIYHKAALTGSATQAQTDDVNAKLSQVNTATQSLTSAKAGKS